MLLVVLSGCTVASVGSRMQSFESFHEGEEVSLSGWMRVRGEVMLYTDEHAMRERARYPECISGVFSEPTTYTIRHLEGQHVEVTGVVYRYQDLPRENTPVIPRKVLGNSIISNFCFGDWVILVERVEAIPDGS